VLSPDLAEPTTLATYVKRRKVAGWEMPVGAVSCTRGKYPTRWSVPYRAGDLVDGVLVEDHEHAVWLYREWLRARPSEQAAIRMHLAGKVLLCWCAPGRTCHVQDVMIPLINEGKAP
jgi:hypothetical protein